MASFSKARFRWREPPDYVAWRDRQSVDSGKWWAGLVGTSAVCGVMMMLWFLAGFMPGRTPPSPALALMLSAGLGLFLSYLLPPLLRLCPSEVKLTERGIVVYRGSTQTRFAWSKVEGFEFREACEQELLCLRLRDGGLVELALDPGIPRAGLDAFLTAKTLL